MARRFLFEEDTGWPIMVLRAIVWSAMMAGVWVAPALAFSVLCLVFFPADADESGGFGVALLVMPLKSLVGASFLIGAVLGFSAGMESRAEEPFWPSRVPHFRCCLAWSAGLLLAMVVGAIAVALGMS